MSSREFILLRNDMHIQNCEVTDYPMFSLLVLKFMSQTNWTFRLWSL